MSKAKQYGMNFIVDRRANLLPEPYIESNIGMNEMGQYYEVAEFIGENGVKYTERIINELQELITNNSPDSFTGHHITGASQYQRMEVINPPMKCVFNLLGRNTQVPVNDMIEILNEWKSFLESLKFEHSLSDL